MKEIKLKECPCCGGEAEMKETRYIDATPSSVKVLCGKNPLYKQKPLSKALTTAQKKKRRRCGIGERIVKYVINAEVTI